MMFYIDCYEKEIVYVFTVLLILFNLVSLYFIVDIFSYDEIISYLTNSAIESSSHFKINDLLFIDGMSNLLFVIVSLMSRLLSE
ncbi:hypothetical protein Flavo103_10030 [Flavobacterium collinsii]|nr:hypothetical protein Flavo103_10030 [Flavobacterium collinsii]